MNYLRNLINALLGRKPNKPSKPIIFVTQGHTQAKQDINGGYYCRFQCMQCGVLHFGNIIAACLCCGNTRWTVRQVLIYDNVWLPACEYLQDDKGTVRVWQ